MDNPLYNEDMLLDGSIAVKQEPMSMDTMPMLATASVPIPQRKTQELSDIRDFGFDLEASNSPHLQYSGTVLNSSSLPIGSGFYEAFSPNAMWGPKEDPDCRLVSFRMDDDDIFQVDKADLIQGPTLAELNANDDTLLEDLNFDDLLLPEENSLYINSNTSGLQLRFQNPTLALNNFNSQSLHNNSPSPGVMMGSSSFPQTNYYRDNFEVSSSPVEVNLYGTKTLGAPFSPESQHSSSSSLLMQPVSPVTTPPGATSLQQKLSTLHELLLKKEAFSATASNDRQLLGQSVPGPSSPITQYSTTSPGTSGISRPGRPMPTSSRLSSSAPTHLGLDQIWQRREPRQHLLSTGSLAEAGSTSSLSTGGVLSPEAHDFSHDEGFDSEDDTEHSDDYSTDNDTDNDENYGPPVPKLTLSMSKKERYFWQYNVQAKGPKGQRLVLKTRLEDPHVLHAVTDPVFSPHCSVRGIKHSGKARKGDGNDLTPNPKKLFNIGKELDKLGRVINDMTPVNELPFNARPKTRKEKNKLASRACRLKKKAQHEANKLKLYGLEHEHRRLINGISQVKQVIAAKLQAEQACQEELNQHMDSIVNTATRVQVAGFSTDYVNSILDKVKNGMPNGGLDDI